MLPTSRRPFLLGPPHRFLLSGGLAACIWHGWATAENQAEGCAPVTSTARLPRSANQCRPFASAYGPSEERIHVPIELLRTTFRLFLSPRRTSQLRLPDKTGKLFSYLLQTPASFFVELDFESVMGSVRPISAIFGLDLRDFSPQLS